MDTTKKFLYLNPDATGGEEDLAVSYPVSSLYAVSAHSDAVSLNLYFRDVIGGEPSNTSVADLVIGSGKCKEVMKEIAEAINYAKDATITIGDDSSLTYLSGNITDVASITRGTAAFVTNGDAALTVTEHLHAGRTVYQDDVSADRTYTIGAPSKAGVTYRFVGVGTGAAADGHDIILRPTDDTVFLEGAVVFLDTDNEVSVVWGNGTNHDQLQINVPAFYDITLVAKSTTVYYITGNVVGATAPAFSNA